MISDIPLIFIPIEEEGYHILVEGEINCKPARLLIDTGASRSVFDYSSIHKFFDDGEIELEEIETLSTGIDSDSVKSELTILQTLKIGKLILKNYKAIIIDMPYVNGSYAKLGIEPIDGIIGNDILKGYGAVIDFNARLLELRNY